MDGFAPWARIAARYGLGATLGTVFGVKFLNSPLGQQIASDPELITLVAASLAGLVEWLYRRAKRKGWSV